MRASNFLLLLCAIFSALHVQADRVFNTQLMYGQFDVITFSTINTDFRKFTWNPQSQQLFVVGTNLYPLDLNSFSVDYDDDFVLAYSFIDVFVFNDQDNQFCAIGPSHYENLGSRGFYQGFTIPIAGQIGPRAGTMLMGTNYAPYSLDVDSKNQEVPIVYFAAWMPIPNNPNAIQMSLMRTFLNLTDGIPMDWNIIQWSPERDIVSLYQNNYTSFTNSFRPWVFHSSENNEVVVVDPNVNTVYSILIPTSTSEPLVLANELVLPAPVVSAHLDKFLNVLFIGVKGTDWNMTGMIYAIDVPTMTIKNTLLLQVNETNPQAIISMNNSLYIGLNGGPHIIKVDLMTFKAVGYVRLPPFLLNIQTVTLANNSLIFATNEAVGKVFRVGLSDFCSSPCSEGGFCRAGTCQCLQNWQMKNGVCEWKETIIEKTYFERVRGGEIALGFIFAVTFLVGTLGWVLWWRIRRGFVSYQSLSSNL